MSADALLRRNLLIYGVGGVLLPFVAIKMIDLLLAPAGHEGYDMSTTTGRRPTSRWRAAVRWRSR